MCSNARFARSTHAATLLAAGGLALAGASAALAQNCGLRVQTSSPVLVDGESASVNVFATFARPPAPNAPYAFASAEFDVFATQPSWTFASAGAIVGNDVLGINVSQPHAPQAGVYADPSNPYRVWNGVFTAASNGPALVEIKAEPTNFSVYPSKLTSSSAPCEAIGGSSFIFVNPLSVGGWLAAPGEGTEIRVHDDVVVDGQIITGENYDSVQVGLLPAVQNLRASGARVDFDGEPVTFTATVQVQLDRQTPVGDMTISFVGLENGAGHTAGANFAMCDGSVRHFAYEGFLGGVSVAAGDLDGDRPGRIPSLVLGSLPSTIGGSAGRDVLIGGSGGDYGPGWTLRFDRPVVAMVRGVDGRQRAVTLDRVEVQGVKEAAARLSSSNNLKQLGLGCHNIAASGVRSMSITLTPLR